MARALKLKNNDYWNSNSVVYGRKPLDKIIFSDVHVAKRTSNLTTDGNVYWYQIGRMVFVLFQDVKTSTELTEWLNPIITDLPLSYGWELGGLYNKMNNIIGCQMELTNLVLTTRSYGTIPSGTMLNGIYMYIAKEIL